MEAADVSKKKGGVSVKLSEVLWIHNKYPVHSVEFYGKEKLRNSNFLQVNFFLLFGLSIPTTK